MIDLDKLLELYEKTRFKNWGITTSSDEIMVFACGPEHFYEDHGQAEATRRAVLDAEFISLVRQNIKELCIELKAAREVAEAARVASKVINNHYLKEPPHDGDLWFARDEIDIALRNLDEARHG